MTIAPMNVPHAPGYRRARVRVDTVWLNRKLLVGAGVLVAIALLALVGPVFVNTKQAVIGAADVNVVPVIGQSANPALGFRTSQAAHPLGTDSEGRDMLAVLVVGAPRTLYVGLVGAGLGVLVGTALGFVAGFRRGWRDAVITTITDVTLTIPGLAVLVVIASFFSQISITLLGLVMAIFAWPIPARLIRAQVLSMRERGYVQMAVLSGASGRRIMFGEMLPNLLPYIAASFTATMAGVILTTTGLETLGLGSTRLPSLGTTVNNALQQSAVFRGMWWWWGPPVVVLIVIFLSLFLMMIGLDEVSNPRLRRST
jgi:peptide/nickel transport system permease protein